MALQPAQKQSLTIRLGSDLSFPINGSFTSISGLDTLLQDIQLLLLTIPGERVFRPTFGATVRNQIWENIDTVITAGPSSIKNALDLFEPRISVLSVDTVDTNRNTGLVVFSINFIVKKTDTNVNLIFPLRNSSQLSEA